MATIQRTDRVAVIVDCHTAEDPPMTHWKLGGALRSLMGAAAVLGAISHLLSAQAAGLALVGATIHPAPDRSPMPNGIAIVRNGKIEAVGPRSEIAAPSGMPVLDLTGLILVPGFWNSHVHFNGPQWAGADSASPARLAESLREMLTRWGFTTVFDTGSPLQNTLALRRRIETGAVDGPTIFTTGDILYPPGVRDARFRLQTSEEAVAASKALLDEGADALKVYAQTFWDLNLKLSPEVLAAVRAEAHRRKVQVFAHPSNRDGLYNAIDAGVNVLVHTTPQIGPWGGDLVAKMKAANIALIPTLKLWRFELLKDKVPEEAIEAFQQRGIEQLREYFSAGGPILFGTDVGYMTDYSTLEEFQKMAQAGMGFGDILASLTTVPAARRGLGASVGRVAAGFDADLVALRADAVKNMSAFADVAYTIKRGRIIYRAERK
jgi:imidazolonepropionase-like amidohydrolase